MRTKRSAQPSNPSSADNADPVTRNSTDDVVALALTGPAPYLVRRLQQVVSAIYAEEMAPYGVTAVQYAALSVVVAAPNLDQNTTAFLAGIDRTTIVGVINRLVRKGLLKRTVSKTDRRARLLKPTAAGTRFIREVSGPIERIGTRLLEPCTATESAQFCELLRRVLWERVRVEAGEISADLRLISWGRTPKVTKSRARLGQGSVRTQHGS